MVPRKKMTFWLLLSVGAVGVAIGIAVYYVFFFVRACNPPLPRESVTVGTAVFSAERATTAAEKSCGLSGRLGLGEGQGMIFSFGSPGIQSFWMKDMKFPIDMIWIGGGKVLGFEENAPPPAPNTALWSLPIYNSPDGTDAVLEVGAGTVAKDNIKVGDPLVMGNGSG